MNYQFNLGLDLILTGLELVPDYAKGTALDAATGQGTQRQNLIGWLREHGAHSAEPDG